MLFFSWREGMYVVWGLSCVISLFTGRVGLAICYALILWLILISWWQIDARINPKHQHSIIPHLVTPIYNYKESISYYWVILLKFIMDGWKKLSGWTILTSRNLLIILPCPEVILYLPILLSGISITLREQCIGQDVNCLDGQIYMFMPVNLTLDVHLLLYYRRVGLM